MAFDNTSSGQTSFTLLTYDLIKEAYAYCQMAIDGEELTAEYLTEGKRTLNTMIAAWQGQGLHLWTYEEGYLFLEANVPSYILEDVRATNRYLQTTTAGEATSGGNTVDLTSTSEIDETWYIGLLNSSNNLVWRQVDSVSDPTVTITSTWPETIASGADVFYYQSAVNAVERVLDVRRAGLVTPSNETPVALESHQSWNRVSDKTSTGSVNEVTYDRTLPKGTLYVWQTPADSSEQIRFTYERKIEDFVNNDDAPDFPKYWLDALVFNLAKRLAIKYRVPPQVKQDIDMMAEQTLTDALDFDNANYDVDVTINRYAR